MPGKITELAALTAANAAVGDLCEVVDVSDTSMAATGTNKKLSLAELNTYVNGTVTAWNPTATGLTKGNGVQVAWYLKQGRTCHLTYQFTFGTTSAMIGNCGLSLPFNALGWGASGMGYLFDSSAAMVYPPNVVISDLTTIVVQCLVSGATFVEQAALGPSNPFAWATGDELTFEMTYLTAT